MYDELYGAWEKEHRSVELQPLSEDFYVHLASYVKKIREESRMLDKKTTKAKLMKLELRNVRRLIKELVQLRYDKIFKATTSGKTIPSEALTEEKLYGKIVPFSESYQEFLKGILLGRWSLDEGQSERPKRMVVRFLRDVPAIVGADMKTYGPFRTEDIGTVPVENAVVLIKQGVAAKIEYR